MTYLVEILFHEWYAAVHIQLFMPSLPLSIYLLGSLIFLLNKILLTLTNKENK